MYLQSSTARILSEAQDLDDAVRSLLDLVLDKSPWDLCAYWKVEPHDNRPVLAEMRGSPAERFKAFIEASRALGFPVAQDLPGRALTSGKPLWFSGVSALPDSPRQEVAKVLELRTALAVPLFSMGRILGVFEFYATETLTEDAALMESLVSMGRQLGQFLERKRAEEDLRRREEQLEIIMDAAPALISYIGADRRYRFNNKAYEDWFGRPRSEVTGRTMVDVLGLAAYEKVRPFVDAVLGGQSQSFETTLRYKDGGSRYVRGHYLPHTRPDGTVEGFIVFIMDLSERKTMEEGLRESEERHREIASRLSIIFNNVNDIVSLVGVEPHGFRLLETNEIYLAQSVMPREKLLGKMFSEFLAPEPCQALEDHFRKAVRTGEAESFEWESITMLKPTLFDFRITPIAGPTGAITHLLLVLKDITQLRQREEDLRQSQKMEAIGRLAGGIAHDFNNLLTAITGFSELAMQAGDPKLIHDMLGEIKRAGDRAADLTKQLLAFSRKQILSPRVLDLNGVVRGMEALLRRLIGEDIELVVDLDPGMETVRIDPGQLEQIILNLVLNARDAMPKGGRLTLETRGKQLDERSPKGFLQGRYGKHVMLAIHDTGTGIPHDMLDRVFEPYFTTKEPGKGTGLGLATVFGIVQQSGGHIHVESEPGKGSCFRIYLPVSGKEAPKPKLPVFGPGSIEAGGGRLILLVEDEEVVRSYTHRVLQGLGYRVKVATHGAEALSVMANLPEPPDLLLSDVIMPGMSGKDLWDRLRPDYPDLRVLFISGYTDGAIVHHGVLDENIPFLPKPFSPEQLAQKVSEVLAEKPAPG